METVAICPVCGRRSRRAGSVCAFCGHGVAEPASADPKALKGVGARPSRPQVQADCSCATYAGVKVHTVNCPEARGRA